MKPKENASSPSVSSTKQSLTKNRAVGDSCDSDDSFAGEFRDHPFKSPSRGHGIDGISSGIGSRLFGARLSAGFVGRGGNELIGNMSARDHDLVERGIRPVDRQLIEAASEAYEVSIEYFMDGKTSGPSEVFAQRIEMVHRSYQAMTQNFTFYGENVEELEEGQKNIIRRLRHIRKTAGHATPQDAARKHGWETRRYFDHEAGSRCSFGRLIGYGIRMGARPEYLVFGTGEMQEIEHHGWRERDASEAVQYSKGPR